MSELEVLDCPHGDCNAPFGVMHHHTSTGRPVIHDTQQFGQQFERPPIECKWCIEQKKPIYINIDPMRDFYSTSHFMDYYGASHVLYSCNECGAMTADRETHHKWHINLEWAFNGK